MLRLYNRAGWALCCILAAVVFVVYFSGSIAAGGSTAPVMPLDDAYIHFQYARQIAVGQFYVYNPGLPPTSGATSFLYPYILAVGHGIGFHELDLGAWAMGVGALALAASGWFVYRIVAALGVDRRFALVAPILFIPHGLIAWHFMSGMETGLAVLFALWTLDGVIERRFGMTIAGAALSALIRPEGALLAVLAIVLTGVRPHPLPPSPDGEGKRGRLKWIWLSVPFLAAVIQPLVNDALTGSAVSSGNAAKSLFGMIPFDISVVIGRIAENFVRVWRDLLTPRDFASDGLLGMFIMAWLALFGVFALVRARERRGVALLLIVWGGVFALAIATLDTAFWHFRRYQVPLIAVVFPLSVFGLNRIIQWLQGRIPKIGVRFAAVLIVLPLIGVGITSAGMLRAYLTNVGYVRDQPLAMARWLRDNTPPDAVIAVHDVGMMRYIGGRTTLDIVGLTTPGAAEYWRHGPGAMGEYIERMRPDYIASYGTGHGFGLGFLQDTPLYGEPLASFHVTLDPSINVALAADTQGVYRPDYAAADAGNAALAIPQIYDSHFEFAPAPTLVDTIDVADIQSERDHAYAWINTRAPNGFPTEYYSFNTIGCSELCPVMEGGRRINGEESFTVRVTPRFPVLLITRLHPAEIGEFDVYVNGEFIDARVIPNLAGAFLEVPIYIDEEIVVSDTLNVRIVPRMDGDYMPYMHMVYQFLDGQVRFDPTYPANWNYLGNQILQPEFMVYPEQIDGRLQLRFWILWRRNGQPRGDYKIFIHVLDEDENIVAQYDARPGNGAMPLENWINLDFWETIYLDVSMLPLGSYSVAFGLYDPVTFERLMPFAGNQPFGDAFGRRIVRILEIPPP
ncbi:MAG: hypothetical protein SGI73_08750 [Chloroflexota bacterium]|nr:hypothetical protein [Chloroflexota bacterium]